MKPEIEIVTHEVVTPQTLPATPRDTSRNGWLRHTGALLGALGLASAAKSAFAQDATTPSTTTPSTTTPPMTADPNAPMMTADPNAPMMMTVPAPTESQAVPGASVVPSTTSNPNNPAETIPKSAKSASPGDVNILNFALGLEYLEADFYARVVAAHQARAYLPERVFVAAQKLANDEAAHVTAITDILTRANATPVARPEFRYPATVFYSSTAFLEQAVMFEETGVAAYLGAAPKVDSKDTLRFAASVYGIECRHTGLIRMLAGRNIAPTETEVPLSMEQILTRVQPFIVS